MARCAAVDGAGVGGELIVPDLQKCGEAAGGGGGGMVRRIMLGFLAARRLGMDNDTYRIDWLD